MSILASSRQTTRLMVYAMVCTLVVAFGTIGSMFATNLGDQYALIGLFIGSALGAFISVYESTIVGCMIGMLAGLVVSPLVYCFIDFETSYMVVFVLALLGAIMGEPLAYFWREAEEMSDVEEESESSQPDYNLTEEAVETENKTSGDMTN